MKKRNIVTYLKKGFGMIKKIKANIKHIKSEIMIIVQVNLEELLIAYVKI